MTALWFSEAKAIEDFPIATGPEIDFAFGAGFDGSNYLVGIQSGSFASGAVSLQLISRDGEPVGMRVPTGESGFWPQVAFDGSNYFVIWIGSETNPGVKGQFVSRSGSLEGPLLTIHSTSPRAISLAYGGGKYLTCWGNDSTLMGQLVTPAGQLSDPSFPISGTIDQTRMSAIAFDGTNFFVVFDGSGNLLTNIYGQFVSPEGILVGSNLLIDSSPDPSDNPVAVAFGGTNYLVAFNDEVGGVDTGAWHVFGRLVNSAGTVVSDRLTIADHPGAQRFPVLASDGSAYLASWNDGMDAPNLDVKFRFFSRAGLPLGSEFSLFAAHGTNQPALSGSIFDGQRFLVIETLGSFLSGFKTPVSADVYGAFLPSSAAPPRLDVAGRLSHGSFPLLLTGTPGLEYAIEAIDSLSSTPWAVLVTGTPTNGTFSFVDTNATGTLQFYRPVRH